MKFFLTALAFLLLTQKVFPVNVTIIESQSYNSGHIMDQNWLNVATGMGYTAAIFQQTTLDNTAFYPTTDILIISSGVITLTATRITNIINFVAQGGHVYIQGEYLCANYNTNITFENIVNTFGGGTFSYTGTVAGTLAPMNVLGSLATTNNAVTPLSYFWYGCAGVISGSCPSIEPYLEYQGQYFGFIYSAPGTGGGRVIMNTDQDWVLQNTSIPLMQNTLTNLANPNYTVPSSLVVNLGPDTTMCQGSQLTLDAGNPGATYLWSNNSVSQTINVNSSGTYFVSVSNGSCQSSDTVHVSIIPFPVVNLGPDDSVCSPATVTLDAGNTGSVFTWSTGASTQMIPVSSSGNYFVQVNQSGCISSDTIRVTFLLKPVVNLGNDSVFCTANSFVCNAGNSSSYFLWSTGGTSQTINVTQTGTYSVTVTQNGCSAIDSVHYNFVHFPSLNLGNDVVECMPNSYTIDPHLAGVSYLWNDNSTGASLVADHAGTYSLTISSSGCSASDSIQVSFINCDQIYVPNAFTPNGDHKNDYFELVSAPGISTIHVQVYNRWGQMIYESSLPNFKWDGTFEGIPEPVGVYVWQIDYALANNPENKLHQRERYTYPLKSFSI